VLQMREHGHIKKENGKIEKNGNGRFVEWSWIRDKVLMPIIVTILTFIVMWVLIQATGFSP